MKKIIFTIAFALSTVVASAFTAQNDGVITVKTNKAGRALVEKWVEAYKAVRPNVQIQIVSGKAKDADLIIEAATEDMEAKKALFKKAGMFRLKVLTLLSLDVMLCFQSLLLLIH